MKRNARRLGLFAAGFACATAFFVLSGWWSSGSETYSSRSLVNRTANRNGAVEAAEIAALVARRLQMRPDATDAPSRSTMFGSISILATEADKLGARQGELASVAASFAKVLRDLESLAEEAPSAQPLIRSGLNLWKDSLEDEGEDELDGAFLLGLLSVGSEVSRRYEYIERLSVIHDRIVACRIQVAAIAMRRPITAKVQPLQAVFRETTRRSLVRNDFLRLTNTTGRTLHHAMVWVELTGRSGETFANLFYTEQWEPGQTLFAVCESDQPARETVRGVRQVRYRLIADELSGPIETIAPSN